MSKKHRPGVKEAHLMVRKLRLSPGDETCSRQALEEIDALLGMDEVRYDAQRNKLRLAYDASRLGIECIEAVLHEHGLALSRDWWNRLKLGHYRFVDQNTKDNAAKEPWSCH